MYYNNVHSVMYKLRFYSGVLTLQKNVWSLYPKTQESAKEIYTVQAYNLVVSDCGNFYYYQ